MEVVGILVGGGERQLSKILSLGVVSSLDSPADGLELRAVVEGTAPGFAGVRVLDGGTEFFSGPVDEEILEGGAGGLVLELAARSPGALLLDNEALPMVYEGCSLLDVAGRSLVPYGFVLDCPASARVSQYTVGKGWSEWDALVHFCRRTLRRPPYLVGNRWLRVGRPEGVFSILSNGGEGLRYLTFRWRSDRSSVLSRVCLRDRYGYYPTAVDNPQAVAEEIRRKRYLVPGSEYGSQPKDDAQRLIRRSMAGRWSLVLELPGLQKFTLGQDFYLPEAHFPVKWMGLFAQEWLAEGRELRTRLTLRDRDFLEDWDE